jgi:alkanesulfonate monooxygenase SsuD/methylene tetrahydromethanopterin reductase-like flavin-dependent oxidoreductase (luciferase family)
MVPQITGTADEVADYMAGIYRDAGAGGFVISPDFLPQSFADFVEGVVPRLQSLNLFQKEYASRQLRDNLTAC